MQFEPQNCLIFIILASTETELLAKLSTRAKWS